MKSGGLLLFNGKNSMHRVTKVNCDEIRILAVLAYNDKPGVSLSKSAQMTFTVEQMAKINEKMKNTLIGSIQ